MNLTGSSITQPYYKPSIFTKMGYGNLQLRLIVKCALLLSLLLGCKQHPLPTGQQRQVLEKDCLACAAPERAYLLQQVPKASLQQAPRQPSAGEGLLDTGTMVLIPAGTFQMGSAAFKDALPLHQVKLASFYMDQHEVTNDQFARFVAATQYVTVAERPLDPADFPGVAVDQLQAGSGVFVAPDHPVSLDNPLSWWRYIPGANWRHPQGPASTIKDKGSYPVVQLCYEDCQAYARWAGKRLPTEAEWEYAARAGRHYEVYYWGPTLQKNGKYMANNYQGHFPDHNTALDGFIGLAPIMQYPASPFGLYDMEGNVWEWCQDYYRPGYLAQGAQADKGVQLNPQGPQDSYDPNEPGVIKRVQRGGSFMCSDQYCIRYQAGARGAGEPSSASDNLGFRLVKSID